jgi:hypothetical protein
LLKVVELSATLTLLVVATNEYQTSGLLTPPPLVPHGLVMAVYVAFTEVPDVLVQMAPCVMLIADAQLSLAGCANKIVGIQMKRRTIIKKRIGDMNLIVWILACFKDWTIYFLLPVKIA